MAVYFKIDFILLLLMVYVQLGEGLECYSCIGRTGSSCDRLDKNHSSVHLKYCGEPEDGYHCIQLSTEIKNHRRMERGCVLLKEGDRNPCTELVAIEVSRSDFKLLSCSMCQIGKACNNEKPNEL